MPATPAPLPYPSPYWAHWRWTDLDAWRQAGRVDELVAVLPLGATEQHGPHLSLGVDTVLADAMVAATLPVLTADTHAVFLPTLPVGYSPEHAAYPGTLTLRADTVLRLWGDVAASVAAAGLRRLVVFNTHGGHTGLMEAAARAWRTQLGLLVVTTSWFNLPLTDVDGSDTLARFDAHERRFGTHAGQIETALMRAIAPGQVDMAAAQRFDSTSQGRAATHAVLGNGRSAKFAWASQDCNNQGAMGDAAAAQPDDGAALLRATGHALATLLAEVQALPLSTLARGPLHP